MTSGIYQIVNTLTGKRYIGQSENVSKLTEEQVWEIHLMYSTGNFRQKDLAQKFDLSRSTIHNILRGETWKHMYRKAQKMEKDT